MKMLCCYDETGRISNLIFEPIPANFSAHYKELGILHCLFDNPDNWNAVYVAGSCHVVGGVVVERPDCPATAALDGRIVTLDAVPEGSRVDVLLNAGTPYEYRETITDYILEFDEPGTLDIHIVPPFPFMEAKYHVEIQ